MITGHGGNIYQLATSLGCDVAEIVDMSSNVNPLGPMPELVCHLKNTIDTITHLPQVDAHAIRMAFARRHGIDPNLVMAGNGSTQWIYTLPLALGAQKALILGPTYADYADACRMHGTKVRYWLSSAQHHFDFNLARFGPMVTEADLVFICNPNNPSGRLIPSDVLIEWCHCHPDTIFIVDESYLPFVPADQSDSLLGHPIANLVVITSMSKIYRLPGLRIGFIKSSSKMAQRLNPYCLPWAVNSLACSAVLWLMQHHALETDFIDQSRRFIERERERFYQRLTGIDGLTFFKSHTSYILIRLPRTIHAKKVWDAMAREKILIRDCSNFHGLSSRYIRISLKDADNNRRAARLLTQLCLA